MKFYIKVDNNGIVMDAITYQYDGYTEIEHEPTLPDGCIGGWYRWNGTTFVFDQALYDALHTEPVELYDEPADMQTALSLLGVEPEEA